MKTISNIVHETCAAINAVLKDYIKMPTTTEEWKAVADDYLAKWNYPNCIGSLDGKHVVSLHTSTSYNDNVINLLCI